MEEKIGDPVLIEIAKCESGLRHYLEDGSVIRGWQNNADVGVLQINLFYHQKEAERLGIDLLTEDGNIAYGKYLYKTQGTKPWNWSRACWKPRVDAL